MKWLISAIPALETGDWRIVVGGPLDKRVSKTLSQRASEASLEPHPWGRTEVCGQPTQQAWDPSWRMTKAKMARAVAQAALSLSSTQEALIQVPILQK